MQNRECLQVPELLWYRSCTDRRGNLQHQTAVSLNPRWARAHATRGRDKISAEIRKAFRDSVPPRIYAYDILRLLCSGRQSSCFVSALVRRCSRSQCSTHKRSGIPPMWVIHQEDEALFMETETPPFSMRPEQQPLTAANLAKQPGPSLQRKANAHPSYLQPTIEPLMYALTGELIVPELKVFQLPEVPQILGDRSCHHNSRHVDITHR